MINLINKIKEKIPNIFGKKHRINFQEILNDFKGTDNIRFIKLIGEEIDANCLYNIKTTAGDFLIYEIDYVSNLEEDILKPLNISEENLLQIKTPKQFKENIPVKLANVYMQSNDWPRIRLYANDKHGSSPYYFNFLIKTEGSY